MKCCGWFSIREKSNICCDLAENISWHSLFGIRFLSCMSQPHFCWRMFGENGRQEEKQCDSKYTNVNGIWHVHDSKMRRDLTSLILSSSSFETRDILVRTWWPPSIEINGHPQPCWQRHPRRRIVDGFFSLLWDLKFDLLCYREISVDPSGVRSCEISMKQYQSSKRVWGTWKGLHAHGCACPVWRRGCRHKHRSEDGSLAMRNDQWGIEQLLSRRGVQLEDGYHAVLVRISLMHETRIRPLRDTISISCSFISWLSLQSHKGVSEWAASAGECQGMNVV